MESGRRLSPSKYDVANQLQNSQDSTGTTTYQYDPAANLQVTAAPPNQLTTNTWDGENRRVGVQLPSGVVDTRL
jgi:YD repeat-containing protein